MTRADFDARVQLFWNWLPFSETSGRRTRQRNYDVGGHELSGHLIGLAVDGDYDHPLTDDQILEGERLSKALGLLWIVKRPSMVSMHLEPWGFDP